MIELAKDIGITKHTILAPGNGWKADTIYLVDICFSPSNVIHQSVLWVGFLHNTKPGNYSMLMNNTYETQFSLDQVHYLKVIKELHTFMKPETTENEMVESHGTNSLLPPLCIKCGQLAVPPFNGKCFACDLAEKNELPDDMVTVTCEGRSIELYREAAIALGLVE